MIKFKLSTILTILLFSISSFAASPGSLDSSFGIAGRVITNISTNDAIIDIAIQPDGKIVAIGEDIPGGDLIVTRYLNDGWLDTSFDGDGKKFVDFGVNDFAVNVLIQADGKILICGRFNFNPDTTNIARLNTNGDLDTTFGTAGRVIIPNIKPFTMALQPDGKLVVGGRSQTGNVSDFLLFRLNTNGSVDSTFGNAGFAVRDVNGPTENFSDIIILNDGKIIGVGVTDVVRQTAVLSYLPNGTPDTTFSSDGVEVYNLFSTNEAFQKILFDNVSPIFYVIAQHTTTPRVQSITAFNYPSGTINTLFGSGGTVNLPIVSDGEFDFMQQSDGKIVAAVEGDFSDKVSIFRVNRDGTSDSSFGRNGQITHFGQCGFNKPSIEIVGNSLYIGCLSLSASAEVDFLISRHNLSNTPTITADFDGDGVTDTAVFRPSTGNWFLLRSSDNSFAAFQFGLNGDVPIDGDFDGDGKSDLAIYRPSTGVWFFQRSSDGTNLGATFGTSTDRPIPGDYDKDGKTDIAIFRPSTGEWLILRSSTNFSTFFGYPFGQNGDIPISSERK